MDFPISVPSIGLVDGKFADEDPLSGSPGSLIPSQWGNSVTQEILNVIEGGGIAPDEFDNAQLLSALRQVIRNQLFTAYSSAGAAPNFTLAVAGLGSLNNVRLRVRFNANGNGADTLNVTGLGAKNLKQYSAAGVKVAPVIKAGVAYDVEYDGTDMVLAVALPPKLFSSVSSVVGLRAIGGVYTNNRDVPIEVNVGLTSTAANQSCLMVVNSGLGPVTKVGSSFATTGQSLAGTFIIPAGATYTIPAGSYTLTFWSETV